MVLGRAQGGRSQSLGRFLGAAFVGFGLLLLLVGVQQDLPPALAGGGACVFAGLTLLAAVRTGRAPLAILDGERGEAVLCRRRLGGRAFRVFPLTGLEITAAPEDGRVRIRPAETGQAGREIPGLPSRIADREWRQGMTFSTPADEAQEAAAELGRWLRLAREGRSTEVEDACNAAEFAALLGQPLPPALRGGGPGGRTRVFPDGRDEAGLDEEGVRPLRAPTPEHPGIRRAPDLRTSTSNRDKRD